MSDEVEGRHPHDIKSKLKPLVDALIHKAESLPNQTPELKAFIAKVKEAENKLFPPTTV